MCSASAHDVLINPAAVLHMRLMAWLETSLTLTLNMVIQYQIQTHTRILFSSLKITHIFLCCIAHTQ